MPEEIDWRGRQVVVTIGGAQVLGYLRKIGAEEGPLQCQARGVHSGEFHGLRWEDRERAVVICSACLDRIRAGDVDAILSTR